MPPKLARVRYIAKNVYLDPNRADLGIPDELWNELRSQTIHRGMLECQRCVEVGRESPWVYVKFQNGRRQIAHHGSSQGPCYAPESDEHKAWKERIATDAERAGYTATIESAGKNRGRITDVLVHGDDDRRVGWEVQLSSTSVHSRRGVRQRAATAYHDGITPSWLTTNDRSPLINQVPWTLANEMPWQQILEDRYLRVAGGVYRFRYLPCQEIPGICPDPLAGRIVVDCGGKHGYWESVALLADDFVAKTAAGLYIPLAIPAIGGKEVVRRWASVEDRDRYKDDLLSRNGLEWPCSEEELPPHLRLDAPRTSKTDGRGNQNDSPLHRTNGRHETKKPRKRQKARLVSSPLKEAPIPVVTLASDATPDPHPNGVDTEWAETALDEPCQLWFGSQERYCGAIPTRLFLVGRRCYDHNPGRVKQRRPS